MDGGTGSSWQAGSIIGISFSQDGFESTARKYMGLFIVKAKCLIKDHDV